MDFTLYTFSVVDIVATKLFMFETVLIILTIGAVLIALAVQNHWKFLKRIAGGLLVSYFTIVLILALGEVYFRYFYAETENRLTLAGMNWMNRYWQTNSLGYRDREWTAEDVEGKTKILVIGDSFAAGWGLKDPADRFSDVLASRLGDDYAVMNAAVFGTSTLEQLDILKKYPFEPDVILWQYLLNDIDGAALSIGLLPKGDNARPPELVRKSYLANFVYYRMLDLAAASKKAETGEGYWSWAYSTYDNSGIWQVHERELNHLMDYAEAIDARLVVVIFPNPVDPVGGIPYVDRVAMVFEGRGHRDVLKLFDAIAGWDTSKSPLFVSNRDTHMSAEFNHWLGDEISERFFASEDSPRIK